MSQHPKAIHLNFPKWLWADAHFYEKIESLVPFYINAICFYSSYQNELNGEACALEPIDVRNSIAEQFTWWPQKKGGAKFQAKLEDIVGCRRLPCLESRK